MGLNGWASSLSSQDGLGKMQMESRGAELFFFCCLLVAVFPLVLLCCCCVMWCVMCVSCCQFFSKPSWL